MNKSNQVNVGMTAIFFTISITFAILSIMDSCCWTNGLMTIAFGPLSGITGFVAILFLFNTIQNRRRLKKAEY